jgi:hypothetical protein
VPIMHPLWQEKGAVLNLQQLTTTSGYKHNRCRVTMLLCQVQGRGIGNTCEWEARTQGTQGKKTETSVAPHLLRVLARFLYPELQGTVKAIGKYLFHYKIRNHSFSRSFFGPPTSSLMYQNYNRIN